MISLSAERWVLKELLSSGSFSLSHDFWRHVKPLILLDQDTSFWPLQMNSAGKQPCLPYLTRGLPLETLPTRVPEDKIWAQLSSLRWAMQVLGVSYQHLQKWDSSVLVISGVERRGSWSRLSGRWVVSFHTSTGWLFQARTLCQKMQIYQVTALLFQ